MTPLASADDVLIRYPGDHSVDTVARIGALLTDASVVVRSWCRQTFLSETTTELIRPLGDRVVLPHAPVSAVLAVGIVDTLQPSALIALPLGAWLWDGGQEVWIGSIQTVINVPDEVTYLLQYQSPLMQVEYTHGPETAPDEVVSVVCSMVIRALDIPGPTAMERNSVGPIAYRLGVAAQDGVLGLTASEQRLLNAYRRPGVTVELR